MRSGPSEIKEEYSVSACAPGDLSQEELSARVKIIKDGGAVATSLEKLQNGRTLEERVAPCLCNDANLIVTHDGGILDRRVTIQRTTGARLFNLDQALSSLNAPR